MTAVTWFDSSFHSSSKKQSTSKDVQGGRSDNHNGSECGSRPARHGWMMKEKEEREKPDKDVELEARVPDECVAHAVPFDLESSRGAMLEGLRTLDCGDAALSFVK